MKETEWAHTWLVSYLGNTWHEKELQSKYEIKIGPPKAIALRKRWRIGTIT